MKDEELWSREWHPVIPPLLEPGEHETLIWIATTIAAVLRREDWSPQQEAASATLRVVGQLESPQPDDKPAVELGQDHKQRPKVRGKSWGKRLSPELFKALKVLLDAFPDPLLIEELNSKAGGGAYKAVKNMRENDLDFWGDAISTPDGERNAGVAILPY